MTLPSGERAVGCACGEGWAAVMTSRRFLRLFFICRRSRPGDQEGDPLCDGTQIRIGYDLIDAIGNRVIATGFISCVGPGASLTFWAGFSNNVAPCWPFDARKHRSIFRSHCESDLEMASNARHAWPTNVIRGYPLASNCLRSKTCLRSQRDFRLRRQSACDLRLHREQLPRSML